MEKMDKKQKQDFKTFRFVFSFWGKASVFFFVLSTFFVVLFMTQYVRFPEDATRVVTPRTTSLPNHDPEDVQLVRELSAKLMPPAKTGHVSATELPPPGKLLQELRALTDYKRGGYFVEVGAGGKDMFSDTLFLERIMGWTGLLVEPDLLNLKVFRRNSWIAPACVSLNTSAYEYHQQGYIRYHGHDPRGLADSTHRVVCYPFHTFWLALNRPVIDYLSLDIGGGETDVLETIPFDRVDIKIVHVDFRNNKHGFMGVVTLMQTNGYKVVSQLLPELLFIKKEYGNIYKEI